MDDISASVVRDKKRGLVNSTGKKWILEDFKVQYVGYERTPVLVFDFNPTMAEYLIAKASTYSPDWIKASSMYPGIWSHLPSGYAESLIEFITPYVESFYFEPNAELSSVIGCYAMPVNSETELVDIQKIPHFDSSNPRQLALVHYLCDEAFGGTGFYRHRETKIEKMARDKYANFNLIVKKELAARPSDSGYYSGINDPYYETLYEVSAKKGRLVLYPSALLHSGLLSGTNNTIRDPKQGRLTITSFLKY